MTKNELEKLDTGDVIRSRFNDSTYTVIANYGDRATAVSVADVTNASEWDLVVKVTEQCVRGETVRTEGR